jgi:hypothetical protein
VNWPWADSLMLKARKDQQLALLPIDFQYCFGPQLLCFHPTKSVNPNQLLGK